MDNGGTCSPTALTWVEESGGEATSFASATTGENEPAEGTASSGIVHAVAWQWWLFLHIVGVLAFVGAHGVSLFVLYRVRGERDRQRIAELIAFSGTTTRPMYVALVVLTVGGVGAGITLHLFTAWWLWISIVILLTTIGLMSGLASPYFRKITAACEVRPSGVPRVSDEELEQLLRSGEAHVITAIGGIGLLAILYLMLFKPF